MRKDLKKIQTDFYKNYKVLSKNKKYSHSKKHSMGKTEDQTNLKKK